MWLEGVKPYLRGERVLFQGRYTELARTIAVSYNGNCLRIYTFKFDSPTKTGPVVGSSSTRIPSTRRVLHSSTIGYYILGRFYLLHLHDCSPDALQIVLLFQSS